MKVNSFLTITFISTFTLFSLIVSILNIREPLLTNHPCPLSLLSYTGLVEKSTTFHRRVPTTFRAFPKPHMCILICTTPTARKKSILLILSHFSQSFVRVEQAEKKERDRKRRTSYVVRDVSYICKVASSVCDLFYLSAIAISC